MGRGSVSPDARELLVFVSKVGFTYIPHVFRETPAAAGPKRLPEMDDHNQPLYTLASPSKEEGVQTAPSSFSEPFRAWKSTSRTRFSPRARLSGLSKIA